MVTKAPDRQLVIDKLCGLAADLAGVDHDEVTMQTHLFHDLGFDSLDATEYIMTIEDHFSVSISDEQAQDVTTIQEALDVLLPLLVSLDL